MKKKTWYISARISISPKMLPQSSGKSQAPSGTQRVIGRPIFGDMTDAVLEDYFHGRTLEQNHKQQIMVP